MKKLLLVSVAFAMIASPALAAGFSFGGGVNGGHVGTNTGSFSLGNAAAGSIATGTNTSLGAGIAATTPAGSITSAVGASAGQSNAASGAFSIGNGIAASGGVSNNTGFGAGVGIALP